MLLAIGVVVGTLLIVLMATSEITFVRLLLLFCTMVLFFVCLWLVEITKKRKRLNGHIVSPIL